MAAVALLLGAFAQSADAATRQDWLDCSPSAPAAARIAGCTRILQSGSEIVADRITALKERALGYQAQRDRAHAVADLDEAIRLSQAADVDLLLARGDLLLASGDAQRAIADYSAIVTAQPRQTKAYDRRALAYRSMGDFKHAVDDYDRIIADNPTGADAFINRGLAYAGSRDLDRAIKDFTAAIGLARDNPAPYYDRAEALRRRNEIGPALSDYDKAVALAGNNPIYRNGRGSAYLAMGDRPKAMAEFDEAIRLDGRFAPAYRNRGIVRLRLGQTDLAMSDLSQAVRLDAGDPANFMARAAAYARAGTLEPALTDFTAALRLDGANADAYAARGWVKLRLGWQTAALADADRALTLAPGHALAQSLRASIAGGAARNEPATAPSVDRNARLYASPVSAGDLDADALKACPDMELTARRACIEDAKLRYLLAHDPNVGAVCTGVSGRGSQFECANAVYLYGPKALWRESLRSQVAAGLSAAAGSLKNLTPPPSSAGNWDDVPVSQPCGAGYGPKPVEGGNGRWDCAKLVPFETPRDKPDGQGAQAAAGSGNVAESVEHVEEAIKGAAALITTAVAAQAGAQLAQQDRATCTAVAYTAVLAMMKGGRPGVPAMCAGVVTAARDAFRRFVRDEFYTGSRGLDALLARLEVYYGNSAPPPGMARPIETSEADRRRADCIVAGGTLDECEKAATAR